MANKNNQTQQYLIDTILPKWNEIEDIQIPILAELMSFLPYVLINTSSTFVTLLVISILIAPPILLLLAILLFSLFSEYEDDNYEILQQFQRVSPAAIRSAPVVRTYIMEGELAGLSSFSIGKFLKFLNFFKILKKILANKNGGKMLSASSETVGAKFFEDVYQTCPTPVIVCAQTGVISFINAKAISIFEFDGPIDAVGMNASRLFSLNSRLIISGFFKSLQKNADTMGRRKTILVKQEKVCCFALFFLMC